MADRKTGIEETEGNSTTGEAVEVKQSTSTDETIPSEELKVEDEFADLDIEIADVQIISATHRPRPKIRKWLGGNEKRLPRVAYFQAETIYDIWKHGTDASNREVGGILAGNVYEDNGTYVEVTATIKARQATERSASLTFTHETWDEMLAELDTRVPDSVVVGWYHTHPGYGIFLSGRDLHIHESFFPLPYQIAVVLEPKKWAIGLFQWHNGRMAQTAGIPLLGSNDAIRRVADMAQNPVRQKRQPLIDPPVNIPGDMVLTPDETPGEGQKSFEEFLDGKSKTPASKKKDKGIIDKAYGGTNDDGSEDDEDYKGWTLDKRF